MHEKIKAWLEWFDNSVWGGALTLLVLFGCALLFWVATPSGLEAQPPQPVPSLQPVQLIPRAQLQTQGRAQDGHETKLRR